MMKSLGEKIQQLETLCGKADTSVWIEGFINGVARKTNHGADTSALTDKQISVIENEWKANFA